jgi:hypothetical protein
VRGLGVDVRCVDAPEGAPPANGGGQWGARASSLTLRLSADVSRHHPGLCLAIAGTPALHGGTEFSEAAFAAKDRDHLRRLRVPTRTGPRLAFAQLQGTWSAIASVLRDDPGGTTLPARLPRARRLVRRLDGAHTPGFRGAGRLLYARALDGVARPGRTYVVGAGSTPRSLRLAVIGFDHHRYVTRTVGGEATSHFHRG